MSRLRILALWGSVLGVLLSTGALQANTIVGGSGHSTSIQSDQDGDGILDPEDNCPTVKNQARSDGDGIGDACDNCRYKPNSHACPPDRTCTGGQLDDGYGNLCDGDFTESEGDGFCNVSDLLLFLEAFGSKITDDSCPDSEGNAIGSCSRYDLTEDGTAVDVSDLLEMIDPEIFGTPISEQGCAEDDTGLVRCPLDISCGDGECPDCSFDNDCPIDMTCEAGACIDCGCPAVWDPVCGTDGETYANDCYARCAHVEVAHAGQCPPG